jgi:hypothetical protein
LIATTQSLVTACFLHFNFDTPLVMRYIGGQHIAAHRHVPAIMKELRRAGVDPAVFAGLERIYTVGSPALCNAATSEKNFRAFMAYGNHKTIAEDVPKTQQALVKDIRPGYLLIMDPWLTCFVPNLHRTPLGMVDLNKPYKNPRPIFDSSFRPAPWAIAINGFTSKLSEPEIVFPLAWIKYVTWLWNLQITYPWVELYLGDDDVSGAFRQIKYNPNLAAMHAFLVFGILFMSTGQTFGDCASQANWEPVARNRQQYARFLWMQIDTLSRGLPHLPKFIFAPSASQATVAQFVQAAPGSLNTGVLDQQGAHLPPQYDHHVDDCLYADVKDFFLLTVAASILALYLLLGQPGPNHRDPVSWETFEAKLTHRRKAKGFIVDTHRMEVSIPDYKRDQVVELLALWTHKECYTLLEAAELLCLLNNLSEICRWARPGYYALQSAIRPALRTRYHVLRGLRSRNTNRIASWEQELPDALAARLEPLIQREIAAILWNTRQTISVTPSVHQEIGFLHDYLANRSSPWAISIGHLVKRV